MRRLFLLYIVSLALASGLVHGGESKATLHRVALVDGGTPVVDEPKVNGIVESKVEEVEPAEVVPMAPAAAAAAAAVMPSHEKKEYSVRFNRDTKLCNKLCTNNFAENDAHLSICSRGCRFFILNEMLTLELDPLVKLNKTILSCYISCKDAYNVSREDTPKEKDDKHREYFACATGCDLSMKYSHMKPSGEPLAATTITTTTTTKPKTETASRSMDNGDLMMQDVSPYKVRQAMIERVMEIFQKFRESSTRMVENAARGMPPLPMIGSSSSSSSSGGEENGTEVAGGDADDGEAVPRLLRLRPSFAVSRSMSIMVTKDADGNRRVVVVRQPPKVLFGKPPFAIDEKERSESDIISVPMKTIHGLDGHEMEGAEGEEEQDAVLLENAPFRNWNDLPGVRSFEEEFRLANSWSQCMYALFLRLLFLLTLLLVFYMLFWLCFATPKRRQVASVRRQSAATGEAVNDPRLLSRLYFLGSLKNKYVQLNAGLKSSPPPSYAQAAEEGGPLPEKKKPESS